MEAWMVILIVILVILIAVFLILQNRQGGD
jgi:hypothetical protein